MLTVLLPQDLRGTAQRLSTFLGCPLAPGTLAALEQHCSFSAMRDNAMANYSLIPVEIMDHSQGRFMRKGAGELGWGGGGRGCSIPDSSPLSHRGGGGLAQPLLPRAKRPLQPPLPGGDGGRGAALAMAHGLKVLGFGGH